MAAALRSRCILCEIKALAASASAPMPSAQTVRHASTQVERKRPSRMSLSDRVARAPPSPTAPPRPTARRENNPFGAMNRTDPGARIAALQRRRTESELKRANRHAPERVKRGERTPKQPGEMRALKMQRSLSQVPYGHRSQVKSRLADTDSFAQFPLLQAVQDAVARDALRGLTDVQPTPIQRLAIPALLGTGDKKGRRTTTPGPGPGMRQFLLAAETGSGKTLAYAIPTMDAVKRLDIAEREAKEAAAKERITLNMFELEPPPLSSEDPNAPRPKAVILLPTAELVDQVGAVFKSMSHIVKLRVAAISAAYSSTIIRNRLFGASGVDILISTPHLLRSIANAEPNILSKVAHLVIDEADSLFDRSFGPLTEAVLDRATPSLTHLVLCSATIPRSLDVVLRKQYPDIVRLSTPNLHAIPRRVRLEVIEIDREPYMGNRDLACADTLWSIGRAATPHDDDEPAASTLKRILVFVNEREKATELAAYLVSKGIHATALTRDTPLEQRLATTASFTTALASSPLGTPGTSSRAARAAVVPSAPSTAVRTLANAKVLVLTDLGSRGIDTVSIRDVVLYDVPHTSIDYIHRLGRVGRMNKRGRGYVLVGKTDRRDIVSEVKGSMFRGQALI